jgi:predicted lipoprotein with Yx(FWY)xxD motif
VWPTVRKSFLLIPAAALALAGCASSGGTSSGGTAGGSAAAPATSSSLLTAWQSPLGTVVVTGQGRAVYEFDKDTPGSGKSACTGTCVSLWHAVTTTSSSPSVAGLTGTVATIPTADGGQQVTLAGHPLYTYAGDSASGQISGEGVMNIWWLVSPAGAKVKNAASSSAPMIGY